MLTRFPYQHVFQGTVEVPQYYTEVQISVPHTQECNWCSEDWESWIPWVLHSCDQLHVCALSHLWASAFTQQYVHYEAKLVGVWNGQRLWALAKDPWSPSFHMLLWSFEISSAVGTGCPCSSSTLQRTGARWPDPQAKLFISWVNLNNTQAEGSGEAL